MWYAPDVGQSRRSGHGSRTQKPAWRGRGRGFAPRLFEVWRLSSDTGGYRRSFKGLVPKPPSVSLVLMAKLMGLVPKLPSVSLVLLLDGEAYGSGAQVTFRVSGAAARWRSIWV